MAVLRKLTRRLLLDRVPLLAICLGHQILAATHGLLVSRKDRPSQGEQREIDFFGQHLRVGFYNTFAATSTVDTLWCPLTGERVDLSRDPATGEVFGLRGRGRRSVQFHPESVLTEHGPEILGDLLYGLLANSGPPPGRRHPGGESREHGMPGGAPSDRLRYRSRTREGTGHA
jgi:phenazine biosynthesis protein phzE